MREAEIGMRKEVWDKKGFNLEQQGRLKGVSPSGEAPGAGPENGVRLPVALRFKELRKLLF